MCLNGLHDCMLFTPIMLRHTRTWIAIVPPRMAPPAPTDSDTLASLAMRRSIGKYRLLDLVTLIHRDAAALPKSPPLGVCEADA